jgi:hypothetical protein
MPEWVNISLELSKKTSGTDTILLCNREVGVVSEVSHQYYIDDFYEQPLAFKKRFDVENIRFRSGFWFKTTERFFVLEQFMSKCFNYPIFHAEVDNLVLDVSGLAKRLDGVGAGFFCPRDAFTRGIGSLCYINSINALHEMNYEFLNNTLIENDMDLLGYMLKNNPSFFSLPTELALNKNSSPEWHIINPETTVGIFDAAALGQLLFGIDPRNCRKPLFNRFINENLGLAPAEIIFCNDKNSYNTTIQNANMQDSYNIYNLHIHSKLFEQLKNKKRFNEIIMRCNHGKRTLMTLNIANIFRWND